MEAKATAKYVRISPSKMRRSVDLIRGRHVEDDRRVLSLTTLGPNRTLVKVLNSAVANAEQKALKENERFDPDALVVTKAIVNGGQPLKRFTAAAQGRATPIRKRTSHVEIHVDSKETE